MTTVNAYRWCVSFGVEYISLACTNPLYRSFQQKAFLYQAVSMMLADEKQVNTFMKGFYFYSINKYNFQILKWGTHYKYMQVKIFTLNFILSWKQCTFISGMWIKLYEQIIYKLNAIGKIMAVFHTLNTLSFHVWNRIQYIYYNQYSTPFNVPTIWTRVTQYM